MLNRATVIGAAIAVAAALVVIVLAQSALGPRPSRADPASPSIPVEELHRQVDPGKLPTQPIPEP